MISNFRNKDTLQIFNERWKVNHNHKKISTLKVNGIKTSTPHNQAQRIMNNINNTKIQNRNNFINKLK